MPPTAAPYLRFVALGDSMTEGLEDPHPQGGYRGWADRLAEHLGALGPGVQYANLAIRGRKAAQIRDEQLAPALAMRPDLASVVGGLNDILRPKVDLAAVARQVEEMVAALRGAGAAVLTMTFADPARVMPLARGAGPRVRAYNDALRAIAERHDAHLVDFERHGIVDPRLWHNDRLHANSEGHARIAEAAADVLGLPGATRRWRESLPPAPPVRASAVVAREAAWAATYLGPWMVRRVRGRSSGDGVVAKRPELAPVRGRPSS